MVEEYSSSRMAMNYQPLNAEESHSLFEYCLKPTNLRPGTNAGN